VLVATAAFLPCLADDDPCAFGGWKPGMDVTGLDDKKRFKLGRSKILQTQWNVYETVGTSPNYRQLIEVLSGRVTRVIREYDAAHLDEAYTALVTRLGEPDAPPAMLPEVKSTIHPFGGSVTTTYRATWHNRDCGQRIQFAKQGKMVVWGSGGDRGALLVEELRDHGLAD